MELLTTEVGYLMDLRALVTVSITFLIPKPATHFLVRYIFVNFPR
jgi:hypothetical protein